jgi:hypothetical protein
MKRRSIPSAASQKSSDVSSSSTTSTRVDRITIIQRAIDDDNLRALRVLSITGGLEQNKLRRQAWPLLCGLKPLDFEKNYKVSLLPDTNENCIYIYMP